MQPSFHRRDILKLGIAAGAIAALPGAAFGGLHRPVSPRRAQPVLRFAHLSDVHVQPELHAADGFNAALAALSRLDRPAELVITGGDAVMDSYGSDQVRTELQWDIYTKSLRDGCGAPIHHCLGNHDIWGWNKKDSRTTGDEPLWGKKRAVETLGMSGPYHSFDQAGWHFVVLDSVQPHPEDPANYIGGIDAAQLAWLEADLKAAAGRNTVVVSHVPILTVTALSPDRVEKDQTAATPASRMITNYKALLKLFKTHGRVRLCLSGHIHARDRVDFDGTTYICDGAVSGSWWKGPTATAEEGFGVVDLAEDGSFTHQYVDYGWRGEIEKDKP